jgi:hypothetical protein
VSAHPARNNKLDPEAVWQCNSSWRWLVVYRPASSLVSQWFYQDSETRTGVLGMFVRVVAGNPKGDVAAITPRNRAAVITLERSMVGKFGKTAVQARISQREKTLTGLAVLLKLRAGRMDASERASAMMYRKTEARRRVPVTEIMANSTSRVAL